MNTYDPAAYVVYVHMAKDADAWSVPVVQTSRCGRLPVGYANRSPRTRLNR